ncbi:MAG: NAD(P)/FAD-dependent oxidoreductase, partial [Gammaproteobacteria bacterium]
MDGAVDAVVIGAGVVGLAIARELALAGHETVVLERGRRIGAETSSRNSGVIHAGIHYPPGSLKARLCVRGRELLYDYLAARALPHSRCGKLVVAVEPAEHAVLQEIQARAEACGVNDLRWLDADAVRELEPDVRAD